MAIHHDKKAYGKLAPSQENVSEERLAEMLKKLKGENENVDGGESSEKEQKPSGTAED